MDAPIVFIESRSIPLCSVPQMVYGNKPTDGGFLFLTPDQRNDLLKKEPFTAKYIRRIHGATEYINNKERYVHMAWTRAVCGRIKSDYRYSKDVVYNNFPWPSPTEEQKAKIEQTAQGILDARALYPDSSLADLYDELTMPPELRKAHQQNDRAVMQAYGFDIKTTTESSCVAELMRMYQRLTENT